MSIQTPPNSTLLPPEVKVSESIIRTRGAKPSSCGEREMEAKRSGAAGREGRQQDEQHAASWTSPRPHLPVHSSPCEERILSATSAPKRVLPSTAPGLPFPKLAVATGVAAPPMAPVRITRPRKESRNARATDRRDTQALGRFREWID